MTWVPRRIGWEGHCRKTRKQDWARGLGSQIPRSSREQEVGTSKSKALMTFSFRLFPHPPSPDNRSSLGPENLSPPPWSLGDFEQLVTSLTLHDPNIFGPQ